MANKLTTGIQIMTAYRLDDGVVVFLDNNGNWTEELSEARVARTPEQSAELEQIGVAAKAANIVVDQYLIDVAEEGGILRPVRLRERMRLWGPTVGHSLEIADDAETQMQTQTS